MKEGGETMAKTVRVPVEAVEKLQEAVAKLGKSIASYHPAFLARMYRARASDLEGKGKPLHAIKKKFSQS